MAANVTINLDTTAPAGVAASIDGGAATTVDRPVDLAITTTDATTTGYQVKIWGDVDGAANANIQPLEANSAWIALASPHAVTLSTGDGVKTLNVRMRDAVGNESTVASDTITLDSTLPVVTVNTGPTAAKISEVAGFDRSSFAWSVDVGFEEYKVKVVAATSDPHTAGTQLPTTAGSTNVAGAAGGYLAATNITTEIDGTDLKTASAGDGDKIVKVFVREASGNWSA